MPRDLVFEIQVLLREHEENNIAGLSIDERLAERVLMAGRIIAAVRHHDGDQARLLEPTGRSWGFIRHED